MGLAKRKAELEKEIEYRDLFWPLDPRTDSLRRELETIIETDRDQGMTGSHDEDDQPHFFDSGDFRGAERYSVEEAMIELVQEQAVNQLAYEMAEPEDLDYSIQDDAADGMIDSSISLAPHEQGFCEPWVMGEDEFVQEYGEPQEFGDPVDPGDPGDDDGDEGDPGDPGDGDEGGDDGD